MLIFDHVFKTAGTSFHSSYVPAAFDADERFGLRGDPASNADDLQRLMTMNADGARRLKIIAGHNAKVLRTRFPDARFITVVRDPVPRAQSAYLHALYHVDRISGGSAIARKTSFREFLETDAFWMRQSSECSVHASVHDGQSKYLLGGVDGLDDGEIRTRLRQRFSLVGHTERFDEFVFLLHLNEGMPLCLYNNRLVRRERHLHGFDGHDAELAESLNQADRRLHRAVCEEFDHRVAALSPHDSARLQKYVAALRLYRDRTGHDENRALRLDRSSQRWEEAEYYYLVNGRMPRADIPATAEREPFDDGMDVPAFSRIERQGEQWVLDTASQQWSYASSRPWPAKAEGVRFLLRVERGEVGVMATAVGDPSQIVGEATIGPTSCDVAVDLWPERAPEMLVIRNTARDPSRVRITSLQRLTKTVAGTAQAVRAVADSVAAR